MGRTALNGIGSTFKWLGKNAEMKPWTTIFVSVLLTTVAAMGMPKIYVETDSYELWVPKSSVAYKNYKHITAEFLSGNRGVVILYEARDGGNVLREEYLQELLQIHVNFTESTYGVVENPPASYQTCCNRADVDLPCEFSNVLSVFNYDSTQVEFAAATNTIASRIEFIRNFVPLTAMMGSLGRDSGLLESAKVIRLVYGMTGANTTHPDRPEIIDAVRDLESVIQDTFYHNFNTDPAFLGKTSVITQRSVDDEITRLIAVDSILFSISVMAIIVILATTLAVAPKKFGSTSRVGIGCSSIFVIFFAVLFSFGMMGHLKITANSICAMICFIVAGVGVDDCIVVENFYQKAIDGGKPRGERMSTALEHGGLAIFLTTSSSVLAFASGIPNDMVGVMGFCACGAFAFTWIFFLSVTFFPAMLVLDQNRIEAKGKEFACCFSGSCLSTNGASVNPDAEAKADEESGEKADTEENTIASTWLGETLTPILTSKAGKALIFPAFFLLAICSTGLMLENGTGLSVTDVVPDDSYIVELVETSESHWSGAAYRTMVIVMKGDFYENSEKVAEMEAYFAWLEEREYIAGIVGMLNGHWYKNYKDYLAEPEQGGADIFVDFKAHLSGFLADARFKNFRADVTCLSGDFDDCSSGVSSAKYPVWQTSEIDTYALYLIEVELNDKITEMGLEGYAWIDEFGFADADASIKTATIRSLATAIVVVMAIMSLLMDAGSAVCIFICVAFIDVDLLGMLYVWNVSLNSVSYSGLIMSIGLCIDYNIHIAHAFLLEKGDTVAKTKYALDLMGGSVLKGGLTTFIGTVVLSNASSTVFRIFFKLCFSTVLLGLLHGLVLMPVLLGFYADLFCSPTKNGA